MKNYLLPKSEYGMFGGFFDDFDALFNSVRREDKVLPTDVKEYPEYYLLEIEAPGRAKSNVELSFKDGYLTITSTKTDKNDGTVDEWKYLKRERAVSSSRSFYIGDVADENITATYNDGVLFVKVPKCKSEECCSAKRIEINAPNEKITDKT